MVQHQAQIHLGRAPTTRPWQRKVRTRIPIISALILKNSRGAKILLIIKDKTRETYHERLTHKYMTQLIKQGVRTIFLTFNPHNH